MLEILQYPFMQRAVLAGVVLAVLLAVLGVFVVLKRMAFFSDGIAHASLAGVAVGILLSYNPLIVALISAVFFALLIYFLEKRYGLSSDTAIGILFTSGMALGVLLISLSPGYQPELISFLFGNILAINSLELWLIVVVSVAVLAFVLLNLKSLVLLSLDKEMAYVSGVKVELLQLLIYVILAVSVVLGIKVLGIVLVSALLIMPVAIAKFFSKSFKKLLIFSVLFAELIVLLGIVLSYYRDLPTGPTIVLCGTVLFVLSAFYSHFFLRRL